MRPWVGLAALLAVGACGGTDPSTSLPDLTLYRVDTNDPIDLGDLTGPAVVNLWATWCAPCRREIPDLERFHRENGSEVVVMGINIGDEVDQIASYLAGLDDPAVSFPQLADPLADVADHLEARILPVTIIIDNGQIVERVDGPVTDSELNEMIAPYRD